MLKKPVLRNGAQKKEFNHSLDCIYIKGIVPYIQQNRQAGSHIVDVTSLNGKQRNNHNVYITLKCSLKFIICHIFLIQLLCTHIVEESSVYSRGNQIQFACLSFYVCVCVTERVRECACYMQ